MSHHSRWSSVQAGGRGHGVNTGSSLEWSVDAKHFLPFVGSRRCDMSAPSASFLNL